MMKNTDIVYDFVSYVHPLHLDLTIHAKMMISGARGNVYMAPCAKIMISA